MAKDNMLELGLLDNALDSINHGLDHYVNGVEAAVNYKYAILHVCQGVELILKERLTREHPVLIYENVGEPNTSKTVSFDTAVKRIQNICNINLGEYIRGLRGLRNARHKIEHYKISLSQQEASALIGSNIPFLMEFLEDELGTTLQEHIKDEETWQELLEIETVFKKAITRVNIEKARILDSKEEGQEYSRIVECPLCSLEYLVINTKSDNEAECLLCKHVAELRECLRCNKLFSTGEWLEEGGLCPDCWEYREEKHVNQYLKIVKPDME